MWVIKMLIWFEVQTIQNSVSTSPVLRKVKKSEEEKKIEALEVF